MNRIKLVFLLLLALPSLNSNAQWISLGKESTNSTPQSTLLNSDESSTTILFNINGFEKTNTTLFDSEFQIIDLKNEMFSQDVGSPMVPQISQLVAIPNNASVSIEVLETGKIYTFEDINLLPAQKSMYEGTKDASLRKNTEVYATNKMFPSEIVKVSKPAVFRDFRIVRLEVSPVQYNPVTKEMQVTSTLTVRLNYDNSGEIVNPKTTPDRAIAPSFDRLYRSSIINYDKALKSTRDTEEEGEELMLCIMPDALYEDFLPYAAWKKKSGVNIHITKFSDIGATASNPITIKNHIIDAYHNWETPPTFVLLVGDAGVFPTKTINYDYSFVYDDYFVEIDGSDFFPEMMIGRFTNQGNYRMKVMINKFEKYEKEPYITDASWFTKGLCCSNNYVESQVTTKEFTRDLMIDYGFPSVDAMMSSSSCSYDTTDVINAINDGRSYVNYRGEGWTDGWYANCTPFTNDNLGDINNGEKFPFFTSIGCGVAMFNAGYGSCFGEGLVQMGTISSPKGAIAFVGPTSNTHTTFNNKIDKGIYKGMFVENMDTPGEALLRGKIYMYAVHGDATFTGIDGSEYPGSEYHYRIYHILGDPSIHIWKDLPLAVNAVHPSYVEEGINDIGVTITYQASGLPAINAQVTLTNNNDLFITGFTDEDGYVVLSGDIPLDGDSVNITARGKDIIPYLGTISVGALGTESFAADFAGLTSKPNPISNEIGTEISYSLFEKNNTSIKIYNSIGQLVRDLHEEIQAPGNHSVVWNGTDNNGKSLGSGVYYCQLVSGKSVGSIKLIIQE